MLKDGEPLGVIAVWRWEVMPFSAQQVALLETFADQALIAIENVRLFKELATRNRDLTEALEQQTATGEVLRVIASSPTDLGPVLETVIANAVRLAAAEQGHIRQHDGDFLQIVAQFNESDDFIRAIKDVPVRPTAASAVGRAFLTRGPVHIPDILADPDYSGPALPLSGRTVLAIPLLREGVSVGAISMWRSEVKPFTERQIELVATFANQAVIAIENVRLFTELREKNRALTEAHARMTETLEQQTATTEILRAISSSPTDLQPVFDTITRSAVKLCNATLGGLHRFDGERIGLDAVFDSTVDGVPDEIPLLKKQVFPFPAHRKSAIGRAVLDRRTVHVHDFHHDPEFDLPVVKELARYRTVLAVPMLREGSPIGGITLWRTEVKPFAEREIELVSTFAHQAVIAIENVRLFTELQEKNQALTQAHSALTRSMEQLTALGEVGRAVSSTLDLETVLTTIVSRAVQLSGLDGGVVFEYDEAAEEFVHRAATEMGGGLAEARRATRIGKGEGVVGRTAITLEPSQVPDITVPGVYESRLRENLIASGIRAILAVPMVRDDRLIGSSWVIRAYPPSTKRPLRSARDRPPVW